MRSSVFQPIAAANLPIYPIYSAYERGTNENRSGIIRRFFSKARSLAHASARPIALVGRWIDGLPRKALHCRCASSAFREFLFSGCPT